jgi:hypothetical protein
MKGCGLSEQKIMKKMNSLHNDIVKLHKKHGVKKSVIKGFKMLGEGIINSSMSPAVESNIKVNGRGASGKMLKDAAVNSTVGVLNSAANRAMYEMDNRGKIGTGFKKGSQEAKDHMARIRAMKKK